MLISFFFIFNVLNKSLRDSFGCKNLYSFTIGFPVGGGLMVKCILGRGSWEGGWRKNGCG